jgi:hypothetical protein
MLFLAKTILYFYRIGTGILRKTRGNFEENK